MGTLLIIFIVVLVLVVLWPKYEQIGEFILSKLDPPKTKRKASRSRTTRTKSSTKVRASV